MTEAFDFTGKTVSSLWWDNGNIGFMVGRNGVQEIKPTTLPGNGAMVPWMIVVCDSGRRTLVNLLQVETLEFKEEEEK